MNLLERVEKLKAWDNTPELKFMVSLRSRLLEEGLHVTDASIISACVRVNLDAYNEDSDEINEAAIGIAEVIVREYDYLKLNNFTLIPQTLELFFRNRFKV